MKKLIWLLLIIIFLTNSLEAQAVFTSKASANWSTGTTTAFNLTSGSDADGIPDADDDVIIASGHTITVNGTYSCKTLTLNSAAVANGISITSPHSLNVGTGTGTVTMNAPSAAVNSTLAVGSGTLTCGNINMNGSSTSSRNTILSISTGTVNCTGITFTGTAAQAQVTFTSSGNLKIATGTLGTGGTFTRSTGTVEFTTTTGGQTINTYTYNNLKLNNTSGTNTAAGNIIVEGTLTTTAGGTFDLSTYTLSGGFTAANSGTLKTSNTSLTPITTGKTWAGTVEYTSSIGGQTFMAGTYNNLTFSNSSGTNSASGNVTVNGTFTTTNGGTIQTVATTLTLNSIVVCGGTIASSGTSTVVYGLPTGGTNVLGGTYKNLTFTNTSGTYTACGNITMSLVLKKSNGGTLSMGSYNFNQTFPVTESFQGDVSFPTILGSATEGAWDISSNTGGCSSNYRAELPLSNSNKWLFTPTFYATAGKTYTLSYEGRYTANTTAMSIYVATSQSSTGIIGSDLYVGASDNGGFVNSTANTWLCTNSGTYCFAIKASTGSIYTCRLDCISISETTPATITWTGNTSSSWSTSTNWDLNRIPISTDIIVIPTGRPNYPSSITAGNYNSLTLTHGGSGTISIGASIFSGNVTLNSSNTGNTIIIAGATSIGGNLSVGASGSNFNFTVNGTTTVTGTFTLGAAGTAMTTTLNYPITSTGAFTMGNNSSHTTNITYTSNTTDAITASNTGNFTFYGTVNYNANSGNQRIMAPTYHGPIIASNGGSRFMNGNLDINNSLTISGGNWFSGSSTEQSTSGVLGNDGNVMLSNSPYKGSGRSGRWQGIFLASDLGGVGANDLITSLSFYINTKYSDRAFNNFTIKAALVNYGSFTQSGLNWPFKSEVMTTVFTPKDVTTTGSAWNTHIFDTPLVWDGTSNILIEITFNNLAAAGGSGLAPDGTSDDQVAYIAGAWADNIIVQTKASNSDVTNATNGSNSNYKNYSVFNIANGPYNINITNNWTNSNGNFYHLQNTVTFDGSSNQNVTTNGDNYYNFTIQNTSTSSALTLLDNCNIENTATLTDGVIVTGNNKFICLSTNASKLTGYSNISFIQGNLRRYIATNTSTYGFPLGKGTNTTNYFLSEIVNNNLTGITYLDGKFVGATPADYTQATFAALGKQMSGAGVSTRNLNTLDSQGYTQLDPNTQPSGGTYSIRLYNTNYTLGDWVDDGQCIMKRPSSSNNLNDFNMAGNINPDGGLGRKVSDGYLLSTGLTTFSEFIPGLEDATPLPIELYNFNVKYVGDKVKINWTTLSEINNDYFTIEKSNDGIHFNEVTKIKGKGNTTHTSHYHTFDYYPQNGINYYRLKQTDFDGKYSYSNIESIYVIHKSFDEPIIYPNPTSENKVNIKFSTDDDIPVKIKIFSNDGKVIIEKNKETNKGVNVIHIDLDTNLTKGIYILELKNEFDILREKIHIN